MKTRKSLLDMADLALKEAVKDVVNRHKQSGRPLVIWKNGKVTRVPPNRLSNLSNK